MTGDSAVRIRLLGGFDLATGSGTTCLVAGKRQRTLIAYLVLHPLTQHDRKHLAFLLWPDSEEQQALTNLRQLIHDVRAILPDPDRFIEAGRQLIGWRRAAPCTVDVDQFEARVAEGMREPAAPSPGTLASLISAVDLYTGDLLPECYDEWIEPERDRLRRTLTAALERLVHGLEARREYRAALPHAERLLDLDPLNEASLLSVMRLCAADGERARALDAFHRGEERLRRELGVPPGAALREFHERLLRAGSADAGLVTSEHPAIALVDRSEEWAALRLAWNATQRGPPRCVLLSGVAGIGKTRLAEEFVGWAARQGATVATSKCYSDVGRLPFAPLADWLRTHALYGTVLRLPAPWLTEISALVPELGATPPAAILADQSQLSAKRRLFEALLHAFTAAPQPLLLVLDDMQWVDRETLEWLRFLLQAAGPHRIFLLMSLRSGEVPLEEGLDTILLGLRREGRLDDVALGPLDSTETAALGAAALGRPLNAAEARALHEETEGHPLYIVEMSQAIATGAHPTISAADGPRSTTGPPARRPLPQRVRAVIEARLAQLSQTSDQILGVASVIGREFGVELLADAAEVEQSAVLAALDELLERRLVREQGGGRYAFSHENIREVAYGGLSTGRSQLLHHRIARAQVAAAAGSSSSAAGIAKHLEQAGLLEGAIPYCRMAAQHALAVCAGTEAVLHLEHAIELMKRLPESAARVIQEIELRTALCVALAGLELYSGPRMLQEYSRVRALCESAGVTPGPVALRTLALALVMRGEMAEAGGIGQRLLAAARSGANPVLHVEARYVLGITAYWLGAPRDAVGHLEAAMSAYRSESAPEHIKTFGQDPGPICGVRLAMALSLIGRAEAALAVLANALAMGEALPHPITLTYLHQFAGWTLLDLGDEAGARVQVNRAIAVAEANGLTGWSIRNRALHGFLVGREGEVSQGIALMEEAAAAWRDRGYTLAVPYDRALLAQLCLTAGRVEDTLRFIEEGTDTARATGQSFWDAELLRLRGELLVKAGGSFSEARRVIGEAIEVATRQGAIALAHRAERSLEQL